MSEIVLSASRIGTFEKCQLQYRYRYIEDKIKPPAIAAVIGTSTHKAVEADLKHKYNEGELMPEDAVADAARDELVNQWAAGVKLDRNKPIKKGEAIDQAVALSILHHTDVAPEIEPIAIERPFGVQVSEDIRLTGHIDVQVANMIRDTKTIKGKPSAMKGDHYAQAQLYAVGAMVTDGELPKGIKIDYLVKNKKPVYVSHEAPVTEKTAQAALDRLTLVSRVIARAMESGDFLPAPSDHWACTEKWCGYYDECPFGAAKRIQA